jgi:agmatinase
MRTYAGIEEQFAQYESAGTVLIPVPYDGTSTWGKGADKGPEAFLKASENMELYDIETDSEPYQHGVYLHAPIDEEGSPEILRQKVKKCVEEHLEKDKFVTLFGGEHSISIGSIQAYAEKFENLTILHIDAHADLRPSYNGEACNHACALHWASQNCNLVQVGIRSMDTSENAYLDPAKTFFAADIADSGDAWIDEVVKLCTGPVYITIDLDGFDPSIMPSTGTPEPGGLGWYPVLRMLRRVFALGTVKGYDIVELCPNPSNRAPDFLAAKLYYKMLAYQYRREAL